MQGMNAQTGKALDGQQHLQQSIRDILTTPKGSRVMRRDYGSELFNLIDAPFNQDLKVEMIASIAEALDEWEPRVHLQSVSIEQLQPGTVAIDINFEYRDGTAASLTMHYP